jgi:RimJ/RimL family protein N-acetyltransferase
MEPPDFPEFLEAPRLVIRPVRLDDFRMLHEAVCESFTELYPWMPWAAKPQTIRESVEVCRSMRVKWLLREELMLLFLHRDSGELVGCGGFHHIEWNVPALDTGYWCRTKFTGQGFISEALETVTTFALDVWRVSRVGLTCDDLNERSWKVAERAGYQCEGILHHDQLNCHGRPRVTRIYARIG